MRVLHVISGIDPVNGGPVSALVGLAEAQVRAGLEVGVAATWCKGTSTALAERLRSNGVDVELIGPAWGRLGSWHSATSRALAASIGRCDVVHIHGLWEDIQHRAARLCQARGVPYVITPHGMLDPWSLRQSKWKKRLYMLWRLRRNLNRAAAIHFTTQIERDLAVPLKLKPPAVVETLGLDLKEFENLPPKGTFRAKYPQLGGRPIVLFLGRLHPGKGAEYLIPAFTHIVSPRRHRGTEAAADAVVVIAGPDSEGYRAKLEALVAGHGIGEQVVFTGPLYGRDRLAALVDADIFCLPSEHENFGIVVIEALACGTPVLISDQVNIHREITAAGVGGVVRVDVGDVAGGLRRWLTDANLRQSAAERAKVIVRERYDWTAVAGRWRAHYT